MANTPIPANSVEPIAQTQDISVSMAWVWSQYRGQIIHAENAASDQSLAWEKRARSLDQEPKSKTLNSDQARLI